MAGGVALAFVQVALLLETNRVTFMTSPAPWWDQPHCRPATTLQRSDQYLVDVNAPEPTPRTAGRNRLRPPSWCTSRAVGRLLSEQHLHWSWDLRGRSVSKRCGPVHCGAASRWCCDVAVAADLFGAGCHVGQSAVLLIVGVDTTTVVGDRDVQLVGNGHRNGQLCCPGVSDGVADRF